MGWTCCVIGCKMTSRTKGLSFFSFPKSHEKEWLEILKMENGTNTTYLRICSLHFPECEMYMAGSIRRLRKYAKPSIFNSCEEIVFCEKEEMKEEDINEIYLPEMTTDDDNFELEEIAATEIVEEINPELSYDALLLENQQLKKDLELMKKINQALINNWHECNVKYNSVLLENEQLKSELEVQKDKGHGLRLLL
ncbi:THAP domain-containing protein 5-like [Zophobas morio]|uniref:THAP domain-containing protein 5-like n=1 Tax=Zophobas morio TaxID=2755281 RepID=UPI0030837705